MNRDDVIRAVNKACLNATAEKIADAIMELQEKKSEWKKTLAYISRPGTVVNFDEVANFIRTEIIEKICEEIGETIRGDWNSKCLADCIARPINKVKARWLKGE